MMASDNADTSTDMSASTAHIFNVVLCYTAYGMSCAKIHNVHTMVMSSFSVDTLSEAKYVLWDECGEHLEAKQQRQDSKNRSKKDAIITDMLDALYSLDSRRMMPLFAIDPSGIGQIPKHNPEQLDAVALHERVRKLESDHHTRDVISELQSKRCDELENKITELSIYLLQHANSTKTLKPTYASISNSVNYKNRHIVKHSTDSTNGASTTANENVPATPSPSVQQEDNEGGLQDSP